MLLVRLKRHEKGFSFYTISQLCHQKIKSSYIPGLVVSPPSNLSPLLSEVAVDILSLSFCELSSSELLSPVVEDGSDE